MWSFLPTVLVLLNGVNLFLPSVGGTAAGLHADLDGVASGCAFSAVPHDILDTVDGVGCGSWWNSSSLHGVDVFGSHGPGAS